MAEAETQGGAVAEQEQEFDYPIRIEDAGPGAKKVSVEIPAERIASKLEEQFKELRQQAAIPGFRPGRAPQKLIEKRFASDVREQVRSALIRESYEQAIERNQLQVLGEPQFDNPDNLKLPENGPLTYSFQVELQPEFLLPDLKNIKVRKPKIEIKEENVDQAMQNLREQQGTLVPVEDRGVEARDYLTADVQLKVDGNVIAHQHDAQIVARPGRIGGIQIEDLEKQIEGQRPGETRTLIAKAPDTHPSEQLRGKEIQVEVALKDIKKLELAEVSPEFLDDLGFDNEQELREALREQMEEKINSDVREAMRQQVKKYLLDSTLLDLPDRLSEQQAEHVMSRRAVDLMMRGIPREQVEANVERLRSGARDEAVRELKLFFILNRIAEEQQVDVDEAELNGKIAMLAAQRGVRPEKLKQQMAKEGSLANLYVQLREQKALDRIIEQAQIEEFEIKPGEQAQEQPSQEQQAEESA